MTDTERIILNIPKEMLERIDDFRRKQEVIPSRAAAIRHLLEKSLGTSKKETSKK
ncbi:MAG: hypothetical protein L3J18_04350 [Candidatus Brocadia sp.]|uniref:Ribbon-helix-helix protein CopG domain-containing protein n=1 Tax=Candidatus Brocadia fulgida TaxID=380242 RepID=A0A0M2UYM8_9BACT|nr:MAG: hypothetical protein BROFUL_00360 [Candidatus Brocadia fulgida]UJS21543.1 MAG: hypothetical protein L3J18_04350 [Candidatus Brocadia sp.]